MKCTREQGICVACIAAVVIAIALGAYAWMSRDPYAGLVTHIEVQTEESVRILAQQRIATAQAAIEAAKKANSEFDIQTYGAIANDALILGDLVLARESLETLLQSNSLNPATWSSYGYTLALMQDYDSAKTAYLRAIEIQPSESGYRSAIQLLEDHFADDQELRLTLYKDAVRELGQSMFTMMGLGNLYAETGDCERAKDHFRVAEDLATTDDIRAQVTSESREALTDCRARAQE